LVAGEFVEVQVRVKCVADLARWKLVIVGAAVYATKENYTNSAQKML